MRAVTPRPPVAATPSSAYWFYGIVRSLSVTQAAAERTRGPTAPPPRASTTCPYLVHPLWRCVSPDTRGIAWGFRQTARDAHPHRQQPRHRPPTQTNPKRTQEEQDVTLA